MLVATCINHPHSKNYDGSLFAARTTSAQSLHVNMLVFRDFLFMNFTQEYTVIGLKLVLVLVSQ